MYTQSSMSDTKFELLFSSAKPSRRTSKESDQQRQAEQDSEDD